jgi:uncharacterized repeat protein (TIGR03899 family)
MSIVKIEGKPIEKLIEVISQGIGTLYKPRAIRKEADAEAYKISVLERAKSNAIADGKLIEFDLYDNIQQRVIYQETRKQLNIDNIIEISAGQLNQESHVSEDKVNSDWSTRFFNIAQDISDHEMHELWGRILAGEIKQPKSFSLRTLELLKNLTKEEAEIFSKFAQLKVKSIQADFIPYHDKVLLETKFKIKYSEILLLTDLGLISSGSSLGLIFKSTDKKVEVLFENGETGIHVVTKPNNSNHNTLILAFTKSGSELSKLISHEKNSEYIDYVCNAVSTPFTTIMVGTLGVDENGIILTDAFEFNKSSD